MNAHLPNALFHSSLYLGHALGELVLHAARNQGVYLAVSLLLDVYLQLGNLAAGGKRTCFNCHVYC